MFLSQEPAAKLHDAHVLSHSKWTRRTTLKVFRLDFFSHKIESVPWNTVDLCCVAKNSVYLLFLTLQ